MRLPAICVQITFKLMGKRLRRTSMSNRTLVLVSALLILCTVVAPARSQTLLVSDFGDNTMDAIAPDGTVSTFLPGIPNPAQMVYDSAGNLYVVNALSNDTITKIAPDKTTTIFASGFDGAAGIARDKNCVFYVVSSYNDSIFKVSSTGKPMLWVTDNLLALPQWLAFDKEGNLYTSNSATGNGEIIK